MLNIIISCLNSIMFALFSPKGFLLKTSCRNFLMQVLFGGKTKRISTADGSPKSCPYPPIPPTTSQPLLSGLPTPHPMGPVPPSPDPQNHPCYPVTPKASPNPLDHSTSLIPVPWGCPTTALMTKTFEGRPVPRTWGWGLRTMGPPVWSALCWTGPFLWWCRTGLPCPSNSPTKSTAMCLVRGVGGSCIQGFAFWMSITVCNMKTLVCY